MTDDEKGKSKLLSLLTQLGFSDISFTSYEYDPIDAYASKSGINYSFEVKNRHRFYDDFILEESKFRALYETLYSGCQNAFYINFIKDYCYIYSVLDCRSLSTTYDYLPTDNSKTNYVWKQTRHLPLRLTVSRYHFDKIQKKWQLI